MYKVFTKLGLLCGVLSVVLLVKHGFELGSFVGPLERMLAYYEGATTFLFGWAEPYLKAALSYFLGWARLDLQLYPHWKHVFILMWLYIGADIVVNWEFTVIIDGKKRTPRRPFAVSIAVFGSVIAVVSGAVAGIVDLHDVTSNVLMAAAVVGGFIVYEFAFNALATTFLRDKNDSWWSVFRSHLRPTIQLAVGGGVVLLLCAQVARVPFPPTLSSPSLAILGASVVALALYRVGVGVLWAFRHRQLAERWSEVFHLSISGPLGLRMLNVVGGAVLFILASAGLQW